MIDLKLLQDIQAAYDAITEVDMDRINRHLDPPQNDEKPLGVVHSMEARRVWAVSQQFTGRAIDLIRKARFSSLSEADTADMLAQATRLSGLAELARDMFWVVAKDDLNGWSMDAVGLRRGWMLVEAKSKTKTLLEALGLGDILKGAS